MSKSKRFTDTGKWDHEWFLDLTIKQKLLWSYLCDHCDPVGIWHISLRSASFFIGEKIEMSDLEALGIGKRLQFVSKDKLWLPGFIKFQYKTLSPNNAAHRGMMRDLVESVGHLPLEGEAKDLLNTFKSALDADPQQTLNRPSKDCQPRVKRESVDSQGKGKGQGKGKIEEEESEEKEMDPGVLLAMWNEYCAPLPKAEKLTDKRRSQAKAQIAKYPDPAHWICVLDHWKASEFCITQWKPTFDDWLNENKRVSTVEGRYANRVQQPKPGNGYDDAARRVLAGIKCHPPGKSEDLKAYLGEELFSIALKVPGGISAIRAMPANDFTFKKLSNLLSGIGPTVVAI